MIINGMKLPCPTRENTTYFNVAGPSAGRDLCGRMHMNLVAQKCKHHVEWDNLTPKEAQLILAVTNTVFFSVRYNDTLQNAKITKEFYVGDRSVEIKHRSVNYNRRKITFDLIER